MTENEIGTKVLECAVHLHRDLGPGLLESVYEAALSHLLQEQGLCVQRQVPVTFEYRGMRFDEGFRVDILVENQVLLEIKSVAELSPAHKKQLQTYLRLTGCKLGYLLNFGAALLKDGLVRAVNGLEE